MSIQSASIQFAEPITSAIPLHVVAEDACADCLASQPERVQTWAKANGFSGGLNQTLVVAGEDGQITTAFVGYGSAKSRARGRFHLSAGAAQLPAGIYSIASGLNGDELAHESLGWLLHGYRFSRYADQTEMRAQLVAPDAIDSQEIEALAQSEALTRDLINTPAADMGPDNLEDAARALATECGADITVINGDDLLTQNFPMIHTTC